jgi:hypothetical protein
MIVERLKLALVAAEAAVGDERQNLLEQLPWDGDLGDLEGDTASMADDLRADLNQLFLQARQRPVLDRLRRRFEEQIRRKEWGTRSGLGSATARIKQGIRARSRRSSGSSVARQAKCSAGMISTAPLAMLRWALLGELIKSDSSLRVRPRRLFGCMTAPFRATSNSGPARKSSTM